MKLVGHIKTTFVSMTNEDTHLLLLFTCLLSLNPAMGLEVVLPSIFQRYQPLPDYMVLLVDGLTYLGVSLILYLGVRRMKNSIRKPVDVLLILYIVVMLTVLQLALLYFVPSLIFWFASFMIFDIVIELITSLALILCAQQISRYCEEGYEGFSINLISGCVNIAIIIGNYLGNNVVGAYLAMAHYSQHAFNYTIILCFELAVIPLLLAFYCFKLRK